MEKILSLNKHDPKYPDKIRNFYGIKAPDNIQCIGNIDLLNDKSIGFCGARDATSKGISTTGLCASEAIEQGFTIVSGNARGVDETAHKSALATGGKTIFVIPEGINRFRIRATLKACWNWENCLVISMFDPDTVWKSWHAMSRNKLIISLSDAMVVVEARAKGGTMNAGLETLKAKKPLFVVSFENYIDGNNILLDKGGKDLGVSKFDHRPNIKKIEAAISLGSNQLELL